MGITSFGSFSMLCMWNLPRRIPSFTFTGDRDWLCDPQTLLGQKCRRWYETEERTTSALESLVLLQRHGNQTVQTPSFVLCSFLSCLRLCMGLNLIALALLYFIFIISPFFLFYISLWHAPPIFCVIPSFLWPLLILPNSQTFYKLTSSCLRQAGP